MKLTLIRYSTGVECTLGLLFIDGRFMAYTLEDQYQPKKVSGETCIPKGIYLIKLRTEGRSHEKYSKRFPDMHKGMLHLQAVPGFSWILMHIGNTDDDTDGCILLGDGVQTKRPGNSIITSSTKAYKNVYPMVARALLNNEKVVIEVCGV